jgi:hypothetical protein
VLVPKPAVASPTLPSPNPKKGQITIKIKVNGIIMKKAAISKKRTPLKKATTPGAW